jgi:hypothetical protein
MFCLCAVLLASGCEKQLHIAKSKMLVWERDGPSSVNYHVAHGDRKSICCTTPSYIRPFLSSHDVLKTIYPLLVTMHTNFYALL